MSCRDRTAPRWSVKPVSPRKGEGTNIRLRIRPNTPLLKAGYKERRLKIKTTDMVVAWAKAEELQRKLNAPLQQLSGLTFEEVYDRYLASRQEEEEEANGATTANYENAGRHLKLGFSGVLASEVSEGEILLAQDYLKANSGLGPSTINLYMRLGAKAWRWAKKRSKTRSWNCAIQPWVLDKDDRLKERDGGKRPLTPVELNDFLDWLQEYQEGRWVVFFLMLCRVPRSLRIASH